jgi:ATP-dependent RNA helicase DeaD
VSGNADDPNRSEEGSKPARESGQPIRDAARPMTSRRSRGRRAPSDDVSAPPRDPSIRTVAFEPDDVNEQHEEALGPPRDVAEVYVNVGRKDGAKASDFYQLLADRAGVSIDDTDYVNVRHRHSFIGVRKDYLDRVITALNGATIAGRAATAEPSRPRASTPSDA